MRVWLLGGIPCALLLAGTPARFAYARPPAATVSVNRCPGAGLMPRPGNLRLIARATLCLIDQARRANHLPSLRVKLTIALVARQRSLGMVGSRTFSDQPPGWPSLSAQLLGAGLRYGGHYAVGEDIAYGTGAEATPRTIVDAWLASPQHRRLLLSRQLKLAGAGIALGTPTAGGNGATYALDLAS